jgi:uncharacterized OB-fold protein
LNWILSIEKQKYPETAPYIVALVKLEEGPLVIR